MTVCGLIDLSFSTPRVHGRLTRAGDLPLYLALYTNPDVMQFVAGGVMTEASAEITFKKQIAYNLDATYRARYWHLSHARSEAPLGIAALVKRNALEYPERAEIGLILLPDVQSTGVGRHTLALIVDHVFTAWPLGVDVIEASHDARNLNAGRLVQGLGFERVAIANERSTHWHLTAAARSRHVQVNIQRSKDIASQIR